MKNLYLFFIITGIATIYGCGNKTKNIDTSRNTTPVVEKKITIYGSENCDHCIEFREKVDSINIKYIFKDVEAHEQLYQELALKIQRANFKGYVSFPVLEINDRIYVKPEFEDFMKLVSE